MQTDYLTKDKQINR